MDDEVTLARETDGYESEEIINYDSSLDLTDYLIPSQRLLPFSEPVQRISRPLLRREDVTPRRSSVMQLQSHSAREATTAKTSRQIPGVSVRLLTYANTHKKNDDKGNDGNGKGIQTVSSEKEPPAQPSVLAAILAEVQKTNMRLTTVEQRLGSLEDTVQTPSSSCSSGSAKYKQTVPTIVRGLVRDIYKSLLEDEEDFDGFDLKKRYTDPDNQKSINHLIVEGKGQDCAVSTTQIQDAARTFFQSKLQQETLRSQGKYDNKVAYQRRRNRLIKKLEQRRAALERSTLSETQKAQWREILVPDFMSSEESGQEDLGDNRQHSVFRVKPLPWRHSKVSKFLRQMDSKAEKHKSQRSMEWMLPPFIGQTSRRPKPPKFPVNFWAYMEK